MRIPSDAEIAPDKLTRYLLVPRAFDDKSKFLNRAGFTLANPGNLEVEIRRLSATVEAVEDGDNAYGTFHRVDGSIRGPNGIVLAVTLIWLEWNLDGTFHFVTLKPQRS